MECDVCNKRMTPRGNFVFSCVCGYLRVYKGNVWEAVDTLIELRKLGVLQEVVTNLTFEKVAA